MTLTPAQLQERREYIGASDVAAVYERSPWLSPLALYLQKTGQVPLETESTLPMLLGDANEPLICKLVAGRIGRPVRWNDGSMPTARKGVLGANIDGDVEDGSLVECKVVTTEQGAKGWGDEDEGGDAIPDHYWLQVQTQMLCTGAERVHVGVLFLGGFAPEFRMYTVTADREAQAEILDYCTAWWQTHVEGGVEPESERVHPQDGKWLSKRDRQPKKCVRVNEMLVDAERQATQEAIDAKKRMENLRTQIKKQMGDAETAIAGDLVVRYPMTKNGSRRWAVVPRKDEVVA